MGYYLADVILDRRMEEIIVDIPLDEEIIHALYRDPGLFTDLLIVTEKYEKGEWSDIKELIDPYMMEFLDVSNYYLEAIDWVNIIESTK